MGKKQNLDYIRCNCIRPDYSFFLRVFVLPAHPSSAVDLEKCYPFYDEFGKAIGTHGGLLFGGDPEEGT